MKELDNAKIDHYQDDLNLSQGGSNLDQTKDNLLSNRVEAIEHSEDGVDNLFEKDK